MKLTIIIPVYNTSAYLESNFKKLLPVYDLLESNEFEIIYINDGSTDDSGGVLDKIKERKSNITVIHQENQGSSGARNSGIDIAKGEYVQFLDSDDYIDFNLVLPLLDNAIELKLDVLSYRIGHIDVKGKYIGEMAKHPLKYGEVMSGEKALIDGFHPSSICCWFFKTSFLNQYNFRIVPKITHMDVEFTTRILTKAKNVKFVDIIGYFYVDRPGSITKPKTQEKIEQFLYDEVIVANLIRQNIDNNTSPDLKKALIKNSNSVVWNLLWRFYKNKNEVSYEFKQKCLVDLKKLKLYPIRGPLKTKFQKLLTIIFNQLSLFKILIK